ncbi:MAG: hypothetical protein V1733_11150 [bacterium]
MLAVTGIIFFSSCAKSDDNQGPTDKNPILNFTAGAGYVSGNITLNTGEQFKVGINAFANANTVAKLISLTITRVFNNKPDIVLDSTMNTSSFTFDFFGIANGEVGQENWIFVIKDKDSLTTEKSFLITTQSTVGPITNYTQKILGAQQNSIGGFFASSDGTIYSLADAKVNASKIDWMYFFDFTNQATLAAPDDPDAATVFTDPTNGLQTWSVKNATRFKKVTDPVDWNAIVDDSEIILLTQSGVIESKGNQLAIGDILAFITTAGEKGLIKIVAIVGEDDGTIEISVKVQE